MQKNKQLSLLHNILCFSITQDIVECLYLRVSSYDFYNWKKKFELRKHWQVYKQKNCPNCGTKITLQHLGKHKRRTFFCNQCQVYKEKKQKIKV
jgi:formamidopyrimidine-DNA glycosylase